MTEVPLLKSRREQNMSLGCLTSEIQNRSGQQIMVHCSDMKRVFTSEEAKAIGEQIGIDFAEYSLEEFRMGLAVELEHGNHDSETDVTGDDELVTGKIAWAHLKEIPDYYTRLRKMEDEAGS